MKYIDIKMYDSTEHEITEGSVEVKNEELATTCKLMVSSDYKSRFLAEYIQLLNRYNGLKNMMKNWEAGKLSFTPTCPKETYELQLKFMKNYLRILVIRAKMEDINLPK